MSMYSYYKPLLYYYTVTDIDPTQASTEEDELDLAWRGFTQAFEPLRVSRPEATTDTARDRPVG
jgi:hypothetical protein